MTKPACPSCGRDLHPETAAVCTHCRTTLERAIANVGIYHADLATVRAGQARMGSAGAVKHRGESHLGLDSRWSPSRVTEGAELRPGVGDALMHETRETVLAWVAAVRRRVPRGYEPVCAAPCLHTSCAAVRKSMPPDGSVTGGCQYLLRNSETLRTMDGGGTALDELTSLERRLRHLIDRPPARYAAGVCSAPLLDEHGNTTDAICPEHLYAKSESGEVRCPACGAVHDIAERRRILLAAAEDYFLSAPECARAVILLGDEDTTAPKLTERIYKWGQRGRISMEDKSIGIVAGRPAVLYRLGAILDLLAEDAARQPRTTAS